MTAPTFDVMARRCDQCLFDPENRIVPAERAAEIIRQTKAADTKFICHKASLGGLEVACRGHHDAMPCRAARFAMHVGIAIREFDPDTLLPVAATEGGLPMKKTTQEKPSVASVPVSEVRRKNSMAASDHVPGAQPRKGKPPKRDRARPATQSKKPAKAAADGGKGDIILAMLKAPGGATSPDIGKAVGWLPNSVRGFFWSLKKKGVTVTATKAKGQPTVYAIVEPTASKAGAAAPVGDII